MTTDKPNIITRSKHAISRKWISPNAVRVLYKLKEKGYYAYLVGGGVRDLLLGREPKDFDIATDATPGELKKVFRNCRLIGRRFRLAHIHFHNEIIEVATFRSMANEPEPECSAPPEPVHELPLEHNLVNDAQSAENAGHSPRNENQRSARPCVVKSEGGMILRDNLFGTPTEDALRRDFTVNALFYNIADFSVIDYVGGMHDLKKGLIRVIGDPWVRFTEDPVRMVRAVRFAAVLGFEIEEQTYQAMLTLRDKLALASPSRMYEEVLKLFLLGEGEKTYQLLRKTGLFGVIFPNLNEWVDTETNAYPHTWIGKALEWIDGCIQAGRPVHPHMLFLLLFGQYIEEKAVTLRRSGVAALDSVTRAVSETLAEQAGRVQIPKKIALTMRDIYWNQKRFERRDGKHPRYFLKRPGFRDAYEYLRFRSETSGENRELRLWWKDYLQHNPIPPEEQGEKKKEATQHRPRTEKSRRRRRNARDRSGKSAGNLHPAL